MTSLESSFIIGIKHDFQCINMHERQGFQHLPRAPADVNVVSEKHAWSLLLHKTFFSLKILGEIASSSSFYLYL